MSKFSTAAAAAVLGAGLTAVGLTFAAPAFADGVAIDLDGDGLRETTVADDEGGDGMYETVKTDVNADTHWDLIMYDRDFNGRAEFATFDQGDDGYFEWILEDTDQNGQYENIFNRDVDQRTPMEKAMENPDFAAVMAQIQENNANSNRLWLADDHDGLGTDDDLDGSPNAGDRSPTDPYDE
jgi:hypothetical protein